MTEKTCLEDASFAIYIRRQKLYVKRRVCVVNDTSINVLTSNTSKESVICFEEALRIIETEITKLRNINWLTCSEQELNVARNKVRELKKMQNTINNLLK